GQDAAGVDFAAVAVAPGLVEPGEGDEAAFSWSNPEWLAALARSAAPFVETRCREQAATIMHRGAERWFVENRFRARIDKQRERAWVLDPGRHQAPPDEPQSPFAPVEMDDGDRLRRRDIVAGRKGFGVEIVEIRLRLIRRRRQRETTAHRLAHSESTLNP